LSCLDEFPNPSQHHLPKLNLDIAAGFHSICFCQCFLAAALILTDICHLAGFMFIISGLFFVLKKTQGFDIGGGFVN
jgi:hypothetical protein